MICPTCKGQKYLFGCLPPIKKMCNDCAGSGEVDTSEDKIKTGKILREDRLKQSMGLRQFCTAHGLDPIIRSKQERGLI